MLPRGEANPFNQQPAKHWHRSNDIAITQIQHPVEPSFLIVSTDQFSPVAHLIPWAETEASPGKTGLSSAQPVCRIERTVYSQIPKTAQSYIFFTFRFVNYRVSTGEFVPASD